MGEQRVEHADYSFSVDTATGTLRRLSSGGTCLVYRVFSALRDERWGTPAPRTTLADAAGRLVFEHDYRPAGYELYARTTIDHDAAAVRVTYEARVSAPMLRNRLGLCLLVPGTLAGAAIEVVGPHGRGESMRLPRLVEPHQPCTGIESLSFAAGAARVRLTFSGEVFEMEDQRNWTDYSFKVYGTPLDLPFPVRLEPGERVEQSISIEVRPAADASLETLASRPHANGFEARAAQRLPDIGTRLTSADYASSAEAVVPPVDYLRIDVDVDVDDDAGDAPRSQSRREPGAGARDHVYRWTRDERPSDDPGGGRGGVRVRVNPASAVVAPDAAGGLVGTDGAFAELNRSRPQANPETPVVFTVSPQVHDRDDEAIDDNLFGLRAALASVRALYPNRRFGLGLLELTPHFNPAAGDLAGNRAVRPVDPRLATSFALTWALAALCEATAGGCAFVTMFDAAGAHGLALDRRLMPAAHLLYDLAEAGFTGSAEADAGGPSDGTRDTRAGAVEVVLPHEDLLAPRRYALRRAGAPRAAVAANLGPESWEVTPATLCGRDGSRRAGTAPQAARWRSRVVGADAEPLAPSAFRSLRRRIVREIADDAILTLPPRTYLFLKEHDA